MGRIGDGEDGGIGGGCGLGMGIGYGRIGDGGLGYGGWVGGDTNRSM